MISFTVSWLGLSAVKGRPKNSTSLLLLVNDQILHVLCGSSLVNDTNSSTIMGGLKAQSGEAKSRTIITRIFRAHFALWYQLINS